MLYRLCDPDQFDFNTTAELEDLSEIIGQERALEAIRFAIGVPHEGFNLFVLGPNGLGKQTAVDYFLKQKAAMEPTPDDWCYVYNFEQPHRPRALRLPPGKAAHFQADMKRLVEAMQAVIPAAFASDEYRAQKKAVEEEAQAKQSQAIEVLRQRADAAGVALVPTPAGFALAPVKDGDIISQEDFRKLPAEEKGRIEVAIKELQENLYDIMRQVPQWQHETQNRIRRLDEQVARYAITPLLEALEEKYSGNEQILGHLQAVRDDVIRNVEGFLDSEAPTAPSVKGVMSTSEPSRPAVTRYQVNVIVDHSASSGAPVIYEDQPTYANLVGRIEHVSHMGTLLTDFSLIKPGVLHRASGGYLILDARKLLLQPYSWEGLKQALRARQIRIESLGQWMGLISTVALEPEPVPLAIKVVLLGERFLYYLLYEHDPDFTELFKVVADFEEWMERDPASSQAYARLISTLARKEGMRHFDRYAVARVIEHSSRLAGDSEKLSTHMQSVSDLLREASFWAGEAGRESVSVADVKRALEAQQHRASRMRERVQEQILRRTILIDTDGFAVGQINGLAVYGQGNFAFGCPNRITTRIRLGKGEVVDIERQVEMGGPIHSKGVLILSSFFASRYAADRPLSLSASLVFEQSYAGVEGDSASSAELYALLSALSDVPINQSIAVTGSVNQHGRIQAIGGANEKIEGFFQLCHSRGLTGHQGVVIPTANVKHLMLHEDVVAAVARGEFQIFAVDTVDQGVEILTGVPAGSPDDEGNYPPESINGRVVARLAALTEKRRAFAAPLKEAAEE
jgi:lon-related putative ATP-dependent protease